jgi:two-component system, sensor histidine kinase
MLSVSPELARSALDAAPDGMIIIDASGVIRFANRQISALFGYSHERVVGQAIELLMPERFRARHIAHRQSYMHSLRTRPMGIGLELFGQRQDGTTFPVEISLSPIRLGEELLIAAAIRDVTDRKAVEAELVLARATADKANQAKSRFLATASHDLRQPLQSLSLLNGTLQRLVADTDALEVIGQQEQAIKAMSRLLNALLDISKLESGAVRPDPSDFAVSALFEQLRAEFDNVAASKGLALNVIDCDDCVHTDRSLVEQILKNLISNAIKYTRQGRVTLRCLNEQAQAVRIEVLDTGIGIPQDQLRFIYDEFYQVGVSANSSRNGYGLGLSIVQRLVALLDLKLDVTSEVGKGSRFSLIVPAGQRSVVELQRHPERPVTHATKGREHVLLVEDDPGVRDATRMLLRVEGYHVTAVGSLSEALAHAATHPQLDLIVTDFHLDAGETGIQVIQAMREALGRALKAVLITGDTSSAVKALAPDELMRFASKPIAPDELLAVLRASLVP